MTTTIQHLTDEVREAAWDLTEPCDREVVMVNWDGAKGHDLRRQYLCMRLRSRKNSALKDPVRSLCAMRYQSAWRFLDPTPEKIKWVHEQFTKIFQCYREGDDTWWGQTKEEHVTAKYAKKMGIDFDAVETCGGCAGEASKARCRRTQCKRFVPNPWYESKEKPNITVRGFGIFPTMESKTGNEFGLARETQWLDEWIGKLLESAQKTINRGQTTRQNQNSLRRKMEGLFEFLNYYKGHDMYDKLNDDLLIADEMIRECELLMPNGKNGSP